MMKIGLILLEILLLSTKALAASSSCVYTNYYSGGYTCTFNAENVINEDEIIFIDGNLTDSKAFDSVVYVYAENLNIPYIPTALCSQFKNLKTITFINGFIRNITKNSFKNCSKLETLGIYSHLIEEIDEKAFINTTNLVKVEVVNNRLKNLTRSLFFKNTKLQSLSIYGNQISELYDGVFKDLTNLTSLNLDSNGIRFFKPEYFKPLSKLLTLRISRNTREPVRNDTFKYLTSLRALFMELNFNLPVVDEAIFEPLGNLTSLWISYQNIETIHPRAFKTLTNITSLNFSYNKLTYIHPEWFSKMTELFSFSLNNNKIKEINGEHFRSLNKLFSFSLNYNEIESIPANTFSNYRTVFFLGLKGNKLKVINADMFGTNSTYTYMGGIDLDNNQINAFDPKFFEKVTLQGGFNYIRLLNNVCINRKFDNTRQISEIRPYFEDCIRNYNLLNKPSKVCEFYDDLTYGYTCKLSNITYNSDSDDFVPVGQHRPGKTDSNVENVVFSSSNLSKIPPAIYESFGNLKSLNIRKTGLRVINNETIGNCENLKFIDVSENSIGSLTKEAFVRCKNLETILLDKNEISQIEPCGSFITELKNLKQLSLKENICIQESFSSVDLQGPGQILSLKRLSKCFAFWYLYNI